MGEPLDHIEGSILCRFIAAQDLRTPKMRDIIVGLFQAGMNEQYARWKADPESLRQAILRDSAEDIPIEHLSSHLEEYDIVVNNVAWFQFITAQLEVAAKRLFVMRWSLLTAPSTTAFITNDVGVVKCVGRADRFASFVPGFAAGRTIWVFPLSPAVAFLIAPIDGGVKGEASAAWVNSVNKQTALDTHRFLYSQSDIPNAWASDTAP